MGKPTTGALNIRHGLTTNIVQLFRMMADSRGMTHGEYLTMLVVRDARERKLVLETILEAKGILTDVESVEQ